MKLKKIKTSFIEGKLKKEIGWCVIMGVLAYLVTGFFWWSLLFAGLWVIVVFVILLTAKGKIVW